MSALRSQGLALAVLCAGSLMIILDGSIVTVALPAIQRDLGFTPSGLTWTVNAYLIAFGGLLLLAGRLGDLLGRRRVFVAGLAVFTLASALCGLATDPALLVAARFLQGAGGALVSAVSLGMLVTLFATPGERARALGAFAFTGSAGAAVGQVLGGVLTDTLGWPWVFLINVPVGVATAALALRTLPAEPGTGLHGNADVPGALLATGGAMLAVYSVIQAQQLGWASGRLPALAAATLVLLAAFLARQATAATPLLPLRILGRRRTVVANLIQLLLIAAMFGFQIQVALYLEKVLHQSALATGLALLPAALAIGLASLGLSARLIGRFGERTVLLTGLALLLVARLLLSRLPVHGSYPVDLLPVMLLTGGFGLAMPALTAIGMSGTDPRDAGVASGLFNTTQQLGAALGVAALSAVAASRTAHLTHPGTTAEATLTGGYRLAFRLGVVLLLTAIALTTALPRRGSAAAPRRANTADRAPASAP